MANLIEDPVWAAGIYQLEQEDLVLGGPDGIDNLQAKQLANRTAYLKGQIESAQGGLSTHEAAADPHPQYLTSAEGDAKVAAHAAAADPHPVYLTSAEGDTKVAAAVAALVASSPAVLDTLAELATALGNDPNFATTITNALSLKAPLASPALTGNPTAPTPAQFDNDTSLATTSFVQKALGSLSGYTNYAASVALALTDVGRLIVVDASAGSRTITLPTGLVAGATFKIARGDGNPANTVTVTGGTFIGMNNNNAGNATTSVVLRIYDTLDLIYDGTYWWCVGGSSGVSLAASGYQKFPSGLIMQWGTVDFSSSATQTWTYPIAFPNRCLATFSQMRMNGTGAGGVNALDIPGLTSTNFYKADGVAAAYWAFVLAIGY